MGFPYMIILYDSFKTVHYYEVTNQNIPNIFVTFIIKYKKSYTECELYDEQIVRIIRA